MTKAADLTRYEHLTRIIDVAVSHAIKHEGASSMPIARAAASERDNLTIAEAATDLETYWQQEQAKTAQF